MVLALEILAGWVLLAASVMAVSANRKVWTFTQPDGTKFQGVLRGDEFYAWHQTPAGSIIVQEPKTGVWKHAIPQADGSLKVTPYVVGKSAVKTSELNKSMVPWLKAVEQAADARAQKMLATSVGTKERVPAAGMLKGVMLLANFSDTTATFSSSVFNGLFNTTGYNQYGASGSVKDYYLEASYGKLTVRTDVYGWFKLPHTKKYYGANDSSGTDMHPEEMITDAIAASDATVNYANYDADGDGYVDFFGVIHQGQGEEQTGASANCIWSHRSNLTNAVTVDGKKITDYHTEPELYYNSLSTIGVICHEMGHVFGLPDLYDTTYNSNGIGDWSIMAMGSWAGPNHDGTKPVHFDPWCKVSLGWLTPTVVRSPAAGAALPAFDQNARALLVPIDPYQDGEYFLVANRYQRVTGTPSTGFEQYLPGSGALILHVDDYVGNNDNAARKKIDVEEADGQNRLDNRLGYGDATDLYTDESVFDGSSNPNSNNNMNAATGIAMKNFKGAGSSSMTCDITPRGTLAGVAIVYDNNGSDSTWGFGYGDGDDYGCVRFTTATGGTLNRVKTFFNFSGTTQYTVSVYSGWNAGKPTGLLTTQSGSHSGVGYEAITLSTTPVLAAGADFYVAIRYKVGSLNSYIIPISADGDPNLRSWISNDGKTYVQLKPTDGNPFDISIRADVAPPTVNVVSITQPGANPTAAATVTFQVNFSAAVLGGTADNFTLAATGLSGCSIASVSGSGATRTVTVNTGLGSGTLGLTLKDTAGMTDLYGRAIVGAPVSSDQAYTVDRVIPVLSASAVAKGGFINKAVVFRCAFNRDVTGFTASDVTVSNGTVSGFSGSGKTYAFTITPRANGAVSVTVPAGAANDAAAPYSATLAATAYGFTYDNLAPTSKVTAPANNSILNSLAITLKWTSGDSGASGVKSVDVIYRKDNGTTATVSGSPFAPAASSMTFNGPGYGVYQFYSIARDNAGNVEKSSGFDVRVELKRKNAVRPGWTKYE